MQLLKTLRVYDSPCAPCFVCRVHHFRQSRPRFVSHARYAALERTALSDGRFKPVTIHALLHEPSTRQATAAVNLPCLVNSRTLGECLTIFATRRSSVMTSSSLKLCRAASGRPFKPAATSALFHGPNTRLATEEVNLPCFVNSRTLGECPTIFATRRSSVMTSSLLNLCLPNCTFIVEYPGNVRSSLIRRCSSVRFTIASSQGSAYQESLRNHATLCTPHSGATVTQ